MDKAQLGWAEKPGIRVRREAARDNQVSRPSIVQSVEPVQPLRPHPVVYHEAKLLAEPHRPEPVGDRCPPAVGAPAMACQNAQIIIFNSRNIWLLSISITNIFTQKRRWAEAAGGLSAHQSCKSLPSANTGTLYGFCPGIFTNPGRQIWPPWVWPENWTS